MMHFLNTNESTSFNTGLICLYIAFSFPPCIGTYHFINTVLPHSLRLEAFDLSFSIMHFGFLMLSIEGVLGLLVIYHGIRNKQKWTWWTTLLALSIVGPGDLTAAIITKVFPFPIFPISFGSIGIILTGLTIFKKKESV